MQGKREWSLELYREFNDRLARKVGEMGKPADELVRLDVERVQQGKLFAHRLHQLARDVGNEDAIDKTTRARMMYELAELADQVEEALCK